MESICHSYM